MRRCKFLLNAIVTLLLVITSISVQSEETGAEKSKKIDRDYVSFGIAFNEFRSVSLILSDTNSINYARSEEDVWVRSFPLKLHTYGGSITYGTYLTETFKTEFRFGTGLRDDTLEDVMNVNLDYWMNWYIGATEPITDYMSAYLLVGVSYYQVETESYEIKRLISTSQGLSELLDLQPSAFEMEDGLFGTNFSLSWMLGIDFRLTDEWFLAVEYGRLLKDTDTTIKVNQFGTYLRYEF
jgi:opacity protein-like surface antigen